MVKNPIAKNLNTFNKPKTIPDKKKEKLAELHGKEGFIITDDPLAADDPAIQIKVANKLNKIFNKRFTTT